MQLKLFRHSVSASRAFRRYYAQLVKKEYPVSSTCNVNLLLSYNTIIKPLDLLEYPNADRLIVHGPESVIVNQIGDSINVSSGKEKYDGEVTCEVFAPIKANFNVTSMGNLQMGDFQGDAVRLYSQFGNVTMGSTKNLSVQIRTGQGDITTNGTVEAHKISLVTQKAGNISANNLKCLGLNVETDNGEVKLESSYCDESYFVTKTGKLSLNNVHKLTKVVVMKGGMLNMAGFDGILEVIMHAGGTADIQISSLKGRSNIEMKKEGKLTLHLADDVLQTTDVDVESNCCEVSDGITYVENEDTDFVSIKSKGNAIYKLKVFAPKSNVVVKSSSWADMVKKAYLEKVAQQ